MRNEDLKVAKTTLQAMADRRRQRVRAQKARHETARDRRAEQTRMRELKTKRTDRSVLGRIKRALNRKG